MEIKHSGLKSVLGPGFLFVLMGIIVLHAEGLWGIRPFVNVEALVIVVFGTAALLWAAYPLRDIVPPRSAEIAEYAADRSVAMGLLGTILGVILLLSSIEDVAAVPRRLALALTCLFFGLFFAEVVFSPMAARLRGSGAGAAASPRRIWAGIVGVLMVLCCFLVILYALSAVVSG